MDGARERWIADFDGAGVCLAQLHLHPHPTPHIMQAAALTTSFVARVAPAAKAGRFTSNATISKVSCKALPSWSPGATRPAYLDGSMTGCVPSLSYLHASKPAPAWQSGESVR